MVGQYGDGAEIRLYMDASSHLLGLLTRCRQSKQRPGHVGYLGNMIEEKDNYSMG